MLAMATLDLNLASSHYQADVALFGKSAHNHKLQSIDTNENMLCNKVHEKKFDENLLADVAEHQLHPKGKHKCCQCAYNSGFKQGALLQSYISLDIDSLGDASTRPNGPYKSVHQAFAMGYSDGVNSFIKS